MLIYAVEASITTFACLAEISFLKNDTNSLTNSQVLGLVGMYLPILVVTLVMCIDIYGRLNRLIFPRSSDKPKTS